MSNGHESHKNVVISSKNEYEKFKFVHSISSKYIHTIFTRKFHLCFAGAGGGGGGWSKLLTFLNLKILIYQKFSFT